MEHPASDKDKEPSLASMSTSPGVEEPTFHMEEDNKTPKGSPNEGGTFGEVDKGASDSNVQVNDESIKQAENKVVREFSPEEIEIERRRLKKELKKEKKRLRMLEREKFLGGKTWEELIVAKEINLWGKNIGCEGLEKLVKVLKQNPHVHTLNLGWCVLGGIIQVKVDPTAPVGSVIMSSSFMSGGTAKSVSSASMPLYEELVSVLAKSHALTDLNLQWNELGKLGIAALGPLLAQTTSLTKLDLSFNDVKDEGVPTLVGILKKNRSITSLVLGDNQMTDDGVKALTDWLSHNFTLNRLEMDLSSGVGDVPVLAHNYSVKELIGSCADLKKANRRYLQRNRELIPCVDKKRKGVWVLTDPLGGNSKQPKADIELEKITDSDPQAALAKMQAREYQLGQERFVICSDIKFSELPVLLKSYTHIKKLTLWNCGITVIPVVLSYLKNLYFLDLGGNQLEDITVSALVPLPQLRKLWLQYNAIRTVPVEFTKLTQLRELDLRNNPLVHPGIIVHTPLLKHAELQSLFSFLAELEHSGEVEQTVVKLMFVGEGNVGKTTLLKCFQGEKRGRELPLTRQTDGVDITSLPVVQSEGWFGKSKEITFDCWDFAGQELYHITHQFFLTNNSIYLLIFNAAKPNFRKMDYWVRSILVSQTRERNALTRRDWNAPIVMVGTHIDEEKCQERKYLETIAEQIQNRFGDLCNKLWFVSAESGENIEKLKSYCFSLAWKAKLVGNKLPVSYVALESRIRQLRENYQIHFLTWDTYTMEAAKLGISGENKFGDKRIESATQYLHNAGVILHFGNDPKSALSKWVITDPQFLTRVFACVVTKKHRFVSEGKFVSRGVKWMFQSLQSDYSLTPEMYEFLLELLYHFDLVFRLEPTKELLPDIPRSKKLAVIRPADTAADGDLYLVPAMLPEFPPLTYEELWGGPQWYEEEEEPEDFYQPENVLEEQRKSDALLAQKLAQTNEKCPYCGHLEGKAKEYCELCTIRIAQQKLKEEREKEEKEGKEKELERDENAPAKKRSFVIDAEELIGDVSSPDHPRRKSSEPYTPKAGDKWYQRVWQFEFVPLGFFSRMAVRILGQSALTVLCVWRAGVIVVLDNEIAKLVMQDNKLCLEVRSYTLQLKLHLKEIQRRMASDPMFSSSQRDLTKLMTAKTTPQAKNSLLRILVDIVETLLSGWYSRINCQVFVPCTSHCLIAKKMWLPHLFTVQECRIGMMQGGGVVSCKKGDGGVVRVAALAPDLAFADFDKNFLVEDIKIFEELGTGSFGTVFRACWRGKEVAVKQMDFESAESLDQIFADFQAEAWVMSLLKHRNLVTLEGISINPPMLIMEYFPDGDLMHFLQKGPPIANAPPQEQWRYRLRIAQDIAQGVAYMHSLIPPVIHRDLKSPNILVSKDGRAKVSDFGTATFIAATLRVTPVENPVYKAPETFDNDVEYTTAVDVYSYGIILWELWTGTTPSGYQPPFANYPFRNAIELQEQIKLGLRPELPPVQPTDEVGIFYAALIRRCWHANPEKRPIFARIVEELHEVWTKEFALDNIALGASGKIDEASGLQETESEDINKSGPSGENDGNAEDSETPQSIGGERQYKVVDVSEHFACDDILWFPQTAFQVKPESPIQSLLLVPSPNGDPDKSKWTIWGGDHGGMIHMWNAQTHQLVKQWMAHGNKRVNTLMLVEATKQIWSAGDDTHICVWHQQPPPPASFFRMLIRSTANDTPIVTCLEKLNGHGNVRCLTQTPEIVFSGGEDGCVRLWDAKTRESLRKIDLGYPVLCLLSVRPYLWVGTSNGVKVLSTTKSGQFKLFASLPGHTRAVKDILLCTDEEEKEREKEKEREQEREKEKELEKGTKEKGTKERDKGSKEKGTKEREKEKERESVEKETTTTTPNALLTGEVRVWTASDDNTICVWRVNQPQQQQSQQQPQQSKKRNYVTHLATLKGHGGRVLCLQKVGAQVWSGGSFDNLIFLWDTHALSYAGELGATHHSDIVRAIVKVDNNTVWTGSLDAKHAITIWKRKIPLPD